MVLVSGCDKGLAPAPAKPYIQGCITFTGNWPPQDSVKILALVLIPGNPPYHVPDLIQGVSDKTIPFIQLNYRSSDTTYRFDIDSGSYGYLGVAENYGPNVFADWRAIGFAHDNNDSSRHFNLHSGEVFSDVNILVDLDSLPKQPFIP